MPTRRRAATPGAGIGPGLEPLEPPEPSGTVIAEGTIPGRAVPWKSPTVTRDGFTWSRNRDRNRNYKNFVAWLRCVSLHAATQCNRRRGPYGGPVELRVTFYLRPKPGRPPDLTNLLKSTEDGLEGVAFKNDSQVRRTVGERVMSSEEPERLEYQIIAL